MTTIIETTGVLDKLQSEFGANKLKPLVTASERWKERNPQGTDSDWAKAMILEALSNIDEASSYWTFVAARLYLREIYSRQERVRGANVYSDFAEHVERLVQKGLYTSVLVEKYARAELEELGRIIEPERDRLFTYIGLKTLMDRYAAVDFNKQPVELPQERWLIIAMTLMQNETENRLGKVEEAYWAMSNLYMTVATPTLCKCRQAARTALELFHRYGR